MSVTLFRRKWPDHGAPPSLLQFSAFIMLQVKEGKGRLRPGMDANSIIEDMFNKQDQNKDGKISAAELTLQVDDEVEHPGRDEL